jgi:hypothetical protein
MDGAGADLDVTVFNFLLFDDVEDGFEEEGVPVQEDAADGLDLSGLEDFWRWGRFGRLLFLLARGELGGWRRCSVCVSFLRFDFPGSAYLKLLAIARGPAGIGEPLRVWRSEQFFRIGAKMERWMLRRY